MGILRARARAATLRRRVGSAYWCCKTSATHASSSLLLEKTYRPLVLPETKARCITIASATISIFIFRTTTALFCTSAEFPYVSGGRTACGVSTLDKSTMRDRTGRNQKYLCMISPEFRSRSLIHLYAEHDYYVIIM